MFGRRMLILVAVLMGLTALAASVSPPPERTRTSPPGDATPPPPSAGEPAEPSGAHTVTARLRADPRGRLPRVRARVGDMVVLEVTGDVVDTVVIGDLPAVEPIDPQSPAHIELYAEGAGSFPIRLLDAARQIGVLEIAARR